MDQAGQPPVLQQLTPAAPGTGELPSARGSVAAHQSRGSSTASSGATYPSGVEANDGTRQTVVDVVVRLPKTLSPYTTVAEARRALDEDDHIHMLLITRAGRLLGTLVRDDLPASADGASIALDYAVIRGRTIAPGTSAEQARLQLSSRGERRRAVVDHEGRLLGLLCLKRSHTGFCSDDDVQSRAGSLDRQNDPACGARDGGA